MFQEPTVFVLGAGASWHYGFPTGEELIREIHSEAKILLEDLKKMARFGNVYVLDYSLQETGLEREHVTPDDQPFDWRELRDQCKDLMKRLVTINPLVIDYFLGQNKHLQTIGRLLIGAALLSAESRQRPLKAGQEEKHDWYRFILYKLCENCVDSSDLLNNLVTFVTFNYDISLDTYLKRALSSTALFDTKDVQTFLSNDRIVHVYGSLQAAAALRETCASESFPEPEGTQAKEAFVKWNTIYWRSRLIRVIDPRDKPNNEQALQIARGHIKEASNLYILGYGFDQNNNQRIGLDALHPAKQGIPAPHRVHFTNFGDSARINKRAGRLLAADESIFLQQGHMIQAGIRYTEKSIRNVYEALAVDFDL